MTRCGDGPTQSTDILLPEISGVTWWSTIVHQSLLDLQCLKRLSLRSITAPRHWFECVFILLVMLMESGSHNTQTYIQNIKGWDVEHNMGNHFKSDTWYLLRICSLTGLQKTLFWFHKQSQRTSTSWFPNRIWSLAYVDACVPSHHHCPRPMDAFR